MTEVGRYMERRKRVHYLINRKMQLGFTLRFMFVTVLFALFVGFEVYLTVWPVVSQFVPRELMHLVRGQVLLRTLLFLVPIILVIASFTILISHRVAGPLFRIQRTIDKVVRGEDVENINLRKHDELKELAAKINELIGVIRALRKSTKG
jgi:HAMP domain-containing protein